MDNKVYGIVYVLTNLVNGKQYVGQTISSLESRWRLRIRAVGRPKFPIDFAIAKYGPNNFSKRIVKVCYHGPTPGESQSKLDKLEIYYIKRFDTIRPNGYNIREGGSRGPHSPESKLKMSLAHLGKPSHRKGKHHTPETLKKISLALKGRIISLETRKRMSEGRRGPLNPMFGKPGTYGHLGKKHTEEARRKIGEAGRGRVPWNKKGR